MPGWVIGRGTPTIGVGAGLGIPAGPGIGCGTPAVAGGRAGWTGLKAPVPAGRGAPWAAIGWLGRGTEDAGAAGVAIAGRGGNIG